MALQAEEAEVLSTEKLLKNHQLMRPNLHLLWIRKLEPAIDIVKAELCALKQHEHVWMLRVLRWDKVDGHWHKVCSYSPYLRPKIELCMRWIAA